MLDQATKVKCPVCEGQGEMLPSQILERFVNPVLRSRLDARIAEIAELCNFEGTEARGKVLDFQKVVHTWNQTLPIWRRSPKE